jgi:hypothetical protein
MAASRKIWIAFSAAWIYTFSLSSTLMSYMRSKIVSPNNLKEAIKDLFHTSPPKHPQANVLKKLMRRHEQPLQKMMDRSLLNRPMLLCCVFVKVLMK